MSTVDAKLIERCNALRRDIETTERATLPVQMLVDTALAECDRAVADFDRELFRSALTLGNPVAFSPPTSDRLLLGFAGAYDPKWTRARIEKHVRDAETSRRDVLRLTPGQKASELEALQASLRKASAALERDKRRVEALDGVTLPRPHDDPAIWLLEDQDLALVAAGKQPLEPPMMERNDHATAPTDDGSAGRI